MEPFKAFITPDLEGLLKPYQPLDGLIKPYEAKWSFMQPLQNLITHWMQNDICAFDRTHTSITAKRFRFLDTRGLNSTRTQLSCTTWMHWYCPNADIPVISSKLKKHFGTLTCKTSEANEDADDKPNLSSLVVTKPRSHTNPRHAACLREKNCACTKNKIAC